MERYYYYYYIMIKKKSRHENHCCYNNTRKPLGTIKTTPADRVIKKLLKNMIIRVGIHWTGCRDACPT